jgi:hypothetical protein
LPWVEERIGLALAESQVAAIRLALMSKVLVMTGGPGVGRGASGRSQGSGYFDPTMASIPLDIGHAMA